MDQELKVLLEENLRVNKANNDILVKMERAQRWGRIFKVVYWSVILATVFGVYYYLQPFIEQLLGTYSDLLSGVDSMKSANGSLPDIKILNELLNNFK